MPTIEIVPKSELEKLSRWTDDLTVREGEELATEGRFAHEFFVIEDGVAKVLQGGKEIAELGPGDFFGEIALLRDVPRTATVRAASDGVLLALDRDPFLATVAGERGSASAAEAVVGSRLGMRGALA